MLFSTTLLILTPLIKPSISLNPLWRLVPEFRMY
nr:MAG TPA: hypothetical protein [Caudoviricetes sp.]